MELSLGILGGTFNPIHTGHIRLALYVQETLNLNRVLVIPDRLPPQPGQAGIMPEGL